MRNNFERVRQSSRWVLAAVTVFFTASFAQAALDVVVVETGRITISVDGAGTIVGNAPISVNKPSAVATVRAAYFTCAATSAIANNTVDLDGTSFAWDDTAASANGLFNNTFVDVTDFVAAKMDPAAPGITDFILNEVFLFSVDGCGLYVIFDDPEQESESTVFILFGAQESTGDDFAIGLAEPIDATDLAEFGLAISFGAQDQSGLAGSTLCGNDSAMFSIIDVNGERLTSCAGNLDDGVPTEFVSNGNLFTIGGLGDNPANPTDPFQEAGDGAQPRIEEDELYTLNDFLGPTDTSVLVETINPSDDDNIFAGHFIITGTAIVGEGVVLSPTSDTTAVNTDHTITARVQDDNGDPVVDTQVDFEVLSGPNAGLTGSADTDAAGEALFTWSSPSAGVDQVVARFVDSQGDTQESNVVTNEWVSAGGRVCDADGDKDVDSMDIRLIFMARNTPASGPDDPRDQNGDGFITVGDARACVRFCDQTSCQVVFSRK